MVSWGHPNQLNDIPNINLEINPSSDFEIDPYTGVITVESAILDFETTPDYEIKVKATSSDGAQSASVFQINVTDNLIPITASFTASIDKWGGSGSSWLDGPSIKLIPQPETISHVVTVATGTNDYRTDQSIYYIDGKASPSLNLISGNTYEFDLSAFSGHPFELSTIAKWNSWRGGTVYNDVIKTNDTLTITVTDDTPDLYYFCTAHSGMGGKYFNSSKLYKPIN